MHNVVPNLRAGQELEALLVARGFAPGEVQVWDTTQSEQEC